MRYQGVCVDSADGSWQIADATADAPARLAWALEYEKSTVYFALDVQQTGSNLGGKGSVFAKIRSEPNSPLKKVGSFEAKRVSEDWDLRNPVVARRVTDKVLD